MRMKPTFSLSQSSTPRLVADESLGTSISDFEWQRQQMRLMKVPTAVQSATQAAQQRREVFEPLRYQVADDEYGCTGGCLSLAPGTSVRDRACGPPRLLAALPHSLHRQQA